MRNKYKEHNNHLNDDLQALSEAFPKMMEAIPTLQSQGIDSLKINVEVDLKFPI